MKNISEMPIAKPLYAERLSDNKEFFVCSGYIYKDSDVGGVNGIADDGEKASLDDGTFKLYRK